MTIEFNKIELSEEGSAALELLKSDKAFTQYLSDAVSNREEAARQSAAADVEPLKKKVDEFRNTNVKLKEELEKFQGFDADEYKRLKELGSDAGKAAEQMRAMELEYQGKLDGITAERDTLQQTAAELAQAREDDKFRFEGLSAIAEHNSKYPAVAVSPKAEQDLIEKMMQHQKVIDGKRVMLDNKGREFTTDDGIGSMNDWINIVGREKYDYMFSKPVGGGAPGSTTGGAGSKQMTRTEFNAISDPVKKSEIARTYAITD